MLKCFSCNLSHGSLTDTCKNSIQKFTKNSSTDTGSPIYVHECKWIISERSTENVHPKIKLPATTQTVDAELISTLSESITFLNISGTWTLRTCNRQLRVRSREPGDHYALCLRLEERSQIKPSHESSNRSLATHSLKAS